MIKTPSDLQLYEKETPTQMFSCEIFEISTIIFSYRTPPMTASDH